MTSLADFELVYDAVMPLNFPDRTVARGDSITASDLRSRVGESMLELWLLDGKFKVDDDRLHSSVYSGNALIPADARFVAVGFRFDPNPVPVEDAFVEVPTDETPSRDEVLIDFPLPPLPHPPAPDIPGAVDDDVFVVADDDEFVEVPVAEPPAWLAELEGATIPAIKAMVANFPDRAQAVLDWESAGQNRRTLTSWLSERLS